MFSFIRKTFDQKIKAIDFIKNNVETFKAKDGTVSKYQQLNTSIPKLRRKYANLKVNGVDWQTEARTVADSHLRKSQNGFVY